MDTRQSPLPNLPCMCASFRRASRALTQVYDDALRPLGLRATQFTVLQVLTLVGEASQSDLAAILALDSTTLTRTLAILGRRRWIAERRGRDRRERRLRLAKAGQRKFFHALPAWRKTQDRLSRRLGEKRWRQLFDETREITLLAKGGRHE
jgi:DNA-binding MarR family transcriptional regulator